MVNNKTYRFFLKQFDAMLYAFVGPFAMLYVFPHFFRGLDEKFNLIFQVSGIQDLAGTVLMWAGAGLAVWCAILMFLHRSTISAFSSPARLNSRGPYSVVRHPMMWAIHIVLIGEILVWNSPMLLVWFLLWLRLAYLYVDRLEEPNLRSKLGDAYIDYCKKTPRWIPFYKPIPAIHKQLNKHEATLPDINGKVTPEKIRNIDL